MWSLPLVVWLSWKHRPIELVFFGIMIDAQFVVYSQLPFYTIFSALWLVLAEWFRPMLLVYTKPL